MPTTVLVLMNAWLDDCHRKPHLSVPRRAIGVPITGNIE